MIPWDKHREAVFLDRYAMKNDEGKVMELESKYMWKRVADSLAFDEKESHLFYTALQNFTFVPGGRILAAAGIGNSSTFYNCYVVPIEDSEGIAGVDSRQSILDTIKIAIEIVCRGGGVGIKWSSLRPRGAYIKGVHGRSSGPVGWMMGTDTLSDQIEQGGSREPAMMFVLDDWHPDVIEFINVKRQRNILQHANLSVAISDRFMKVLKEDGIWEFIFPDIRDPNYDEMWDGNIEGWVSAGRPIIKHGEIKARELWKIICESAWENGEPGVVFLERYNKLSNTWYCDPIISVNPCFTGNMRLLTEDGYKRFDEIVGAVNIVNGDGKVVHGKVWKTGTKNIVQLKLSDKRIIECTPDHKFMTTDGESIPARDLKGKKLMPNVNFTKNFDMFYIKLGFIQGDGQLTRLGEKHPRHKGIEVDIGKKDWGLLTLFEGDAYSQGERKIYLQGYNDILLNLGFYPAISTQRVFPLKYNEWNRKQQRSFLRGCYSANGSVCTRITYKTTSIVFAKQLITSLETFGIKAYLTTNKQKNIQFKNGNYECKESYDVNIAQYKSIQTFFEEIGFELEYRNEKLKNLLLKRAPFVERITNGDNAVVYDFSEPETNWGVVEGVVVHNCGEQGLNGWGACNLGSINLVQLINSSTGEIDWPRLKEIVHVGVRLLDNVIDLNVYINDKMKRSQMNNRRIGIGTMGLADTMLVNKIRYGSEKSLEFIHYLYKFIRNEAYKASIELAKERGPAPNFDVDKYLRSEFIKTLPEGIREDIRKHGVRNMTLLTQAPTGTTSLLAGVSSGIEPIYQWTYKRVDNMGEHVIKHPTYTLYENEDKLPEFMVTAHDLTPEEHVLVQAVVQQYVDSSISKTVNAPENHTVDQVDKLYRMAYEYNCKGVTYYRDGSRTGVYQKIEETASEIIKPKTRPKVLSGKTVKWDTPLGNLLVTLNLDEYGRPFETICQLGKNGSDVLAFTEAIGRLISISLRSGIDIESIIHHLKEIGGSSSLGYGSNRVKSVPDAIAQALMFMTETTEVENTVGEICPQCQNYTLIRQEGCMSCVRCDYYKC